MLKLFIVCVVIILLAEVEQATAPLEEKLGKNSSNKFIDDNQ